MGTDAERAVLELLREQRMLLFVGAGLSRELGYPLWNDYLAELEKELGAEAPATDDPLERAEWIKRSFIDGERQDDYLAHIQQCFGPKLAPPYTQLQHALLRLGFRGVITTNFDPSLENALSIGNLAACSSRLHRLGSRRSAIFRRLRLLEARRSRTYNRVRPPPPRRA